MDTSRIMLPTLICLTIAFVYYMKFHPKKSNKLLDKSQKNKNEQKEEEKKLRSKNKDNKSKNEQEEEEEKEKVKENNNVEEKKEVKNEALTYNALFDKFCDYIQKNKLVSVESISQKLNKTKEETIKFLRELENEGKLVGFLGADGEYFYLTTKELDLLNNLLMNSKKKVISEGELENQFKQIISERDQSIL